MKNKFLLLLVENAAIELIALFLVFRFSENGAGIYSVVFIIILALTGLQGYVQIVRPYTDKMEELEKAAEESQESEHIRREFVANVSHELKTPLTSISGFIETLQDGAADDPEIRTKFIDIIAIETARLKRLIEDLLVLSDIESRRDSEQQEFDVSTAIMNTVEALRPIADDKQITILMDLDEGCSIRGSVDRFRQMMVNLIENAIKYSDKDSRIWVNAKDKDGQLTISVRDEGIGIAPEHHDRLFERFYRVDKSRSKKAGGTGLGLSIVKHIAVLLGAKLSVESQVGEGTTFYVIFDT
ncbi:MAG: ATP-binding protein [Lentihominibacter sp.]|nr:ATP-binding protein [Lentihominibacter sp.]